MDFIGRQQELAIMEERYASGKFEFCVMYGRRRVGKTTLINRFASGKRTVFFSALKASAEENLSLLSAAIMSTASNDVLEASFDSFDAALRQLFKMAQHDRLVFVIDEYPYLAESYPAISSLLQHLIDNHQAESLMYLILNGSSMTQMTAEFFGSNRPLYGRKTFQIKLKPFGFFGLREGFNSTEPTTLAKVYAIYGGTPKYFEGYREERSLRHNIVSDFLTIGSPLLEEPEAVLNQEVREASVYNSLFVAIARGAHKYSELSARSGISSGNVSRYLDNLEFLDLIRREVPAYTLENKKALYRIDDNMFRFWYRFISRNLSLINSGKADIAYRNIESGLDLFMGEAFERICLEYLWQINGTGKLPFDFTNAGRWWGGNPKVITEAEIDILAHDDNDHALFCECKWSDNPVGIDILEAVDMLTHLPQFSEFKQKGIMLFSKSSFTEDCVQAAETRGDVQLVSLPEMLE
jgi:AAA+ ATPase superfamily predicted ATPase